MNNYLVGNLLKEYQTNKSKIRLLGYKGKQNLQTTKELEELKDNMDKLDYCISCLPEPEKSLITNIYIKKMSIRNISKIMIMARTSVTRKRDSAIKILENLFQNC